MKAWADYFEKEDITEIIEVASEVYAQKNPFISEEELAEQSIESLIAAISRFDRSVIQRAKETVIRLIP